MSISRRDFLGAGCGGSGGPRHSRKGRGSRRGGAIRRSPRPRRPTVVISATTASIGTIRVAARSEVAYDMLVAGADPLDAIVAGVNIVELDPNDQSVGLGGLPNEEGVVQLDASCMHGPTKRAGAVGASRTSRRPPLVAKAVMDHTDHILLVGAGAKKFALEMGFKEQNLLTEKSRARLAAWKARLNPNDNWLDIPRRHDAKARPTPATSTRARPPRGDDDHVFYDEQACHTPSARST